MKHKLPFLSKRIDDLFVVYYLTLVAIIEGVAFILIIENLFHDKDKENIIEHLQACWPYAAMSLLMVIMISFQYAVFLISLRWMLRIWDTVLPFLLGMTQAAQTFFFEEPWLWWLMLSLLCIVAILTYVVNLTATNQWEKGSEAYVLIRKTFYKSIVMTAVSGVFAGIISKGLSDGWIEEATSPYLLFVLLIVSFYFMRENSIAGTRIMTIINKKELQHE